MITYQEWYADLQAVPPKQQSGFILESLRGKKHLHIFGRFFFPHIIKGTADVPACHMELIAELNSPGSSAIIFPRGFAKSTWEKIDTIHDCVYGLEAVILYISTTLRQAQFHFESIKSELESNELLLGVYGDLVPPPSNDGRKWTNIHFETLNKVNVVARGAGRGRGVNIKNNRPTKIIADDIENDESVRSGEQRQKLHDWLYNVIFPSRDKEKGRIKMIGTVLHEQAEIRMFYEKHGGLFRKAIEDGKSIWDRFSLDDLAKIREEIGTKAFMQEYMNEPSNDALANFDPLWIDDNTYTALPHDKSKWMKYIHLDPQAGMTGLADEFCITVIGKQKVNAHKYVIEQKAGRISQAQQAAQFVLMWYKHKDTTVSCGIEKVLNQTAVYQMVLDWKNGSLILPGCEHITNKNIPVRAVSPEGKDKVARLQMFEADFERGEVHLRPEMKTLRYQILFLGSKSLDHDDRADSLVGALELSVKTIGFGDIEKNMYNTDKDNSSTISGNLYNKSF